MNRIGIFGGTFAPFHQGHRLALKAFLSLANLDKCLVIPAGIPPHKTKTRLFTDIQRLEMTRRACSDLPNTVVTDLEIKKNSQSYTCETLAYLCTQYPRDRLVLYVGSDMFLTLQDWHLPQEIFDRAEIAAFSRTGEDLAVLNRHREILMKEFNGVDCTVYSINPFPVSSTEIREKWCKGEDISSLVPPAVLEYLNFLREEVCP